ncbi:MAG: prolyl oligopeptidase family serine peptidase [Acidobacteriia bacterium]|nr:prolyl oligopeptidase family serine peptidase [Terriglobia bacterium]
MRILVVLAFASVFCGAATIDQYLGAPFASEMHAAPGGGKVVWILNERGARNLWVAGAPDYKGHRLTSYKEDDGQDVGMIEWTADGKSIIYVRGGNLEQIGQVAPNPRSWAQMPDQSIWIVPFEGGAPKKLAEGHSPAVSKDGKVAFVRATQVWMTNINGDKPAEVAHTKGISSSLRWSPDGSQLAFVNARGDHSFVGVYHPGDRSVKYLDPSTDRDSSPVWSVDGRRIAFIRTASVTLAGGAGPRREALTPWSIRIADVATGQGREVWHADKGPGSVHHAMVAEDQLLWADGDRLAFAWEKSGYLRLYAVSAEGGPAKLLTPGDNFEIEHVSLTEDRKNLLFSSNQDDIDRRHIWRVAVAGGTAAPVLGSLGQGIEWEPQDAGNGAVAYFRSSPNEIGRAVVKLASGAPKDLAPDSIPADFPSHDMVVPHQVIFPASDGMMIHGQLFVPRMTSGEKRPAIIFFHGGSRRQMLLGFHYMYYYSNDYAMNQYLASKGYVVLSVNYRSGIGYGLNFREAINYGATGASEYNDVMGAGLYMKSRAEVDPARIGVWGGSYGGYLTAMALSRSSDLFAAGVDLHGVHDWSARGGSVANPNLDPEKQREQMRVAFESSPMAAIKTWKSPVLLIHGDDDRNVDFSQTVKLAEALRAQGTEFEELIFPDEIHDFLLWEHWVKAMKAGDEFFGRKLKK